MQHYGNKEIMMGKKGKKIPCARRSGNWSTGARRRLAFARARSARYRNILLTAPAPELAGFNPELLYVECGRCGSPVIWEPGRATRLMGEAGIDPLELDSSCMLVTDACPACGEKDEYTVRIFRIAKASGIDLPVRLGHA